MQRAARALRRAAFALPALLAPAAPCAAATDYPVKPIRMVVPYAPGGPVDIVARTVGQKLGDALGGTVVIDNRAGANGNIGSEIVVRSAPDGYTLLMGANGNIAINPSLYPHMPFDPLRDLAPVALIASSALLLVIHPSLPAASVRELIELAKHRAGAINVASAGNGSTAHLAAELFRTMAGIDITHIPYKGAGPALADVAAGQAQATITGVSGALPFVKSGKIRALGVTGPRRIALLPDVPTIAETLPGYEVETWYGVFAPAATPRTIVLALNQSLAVILASADARERMASLGAEIATGTPEQFGHAVRVEKDKWAKVVKQAGLRLD